MSSLASFAIQSAQTTASSATLNISMYDPFNYYAVGELWLYRTQLDDSGSPLTDAGTVKEWEEAGRLDVKRMSATPADDSVLFTGLAANQTYSVILGCYDENGTFTQKDYTTFTTTSLNNWMNIEEITWYNVAVSAHIDASDEVPSELWGVVIPSEESTIDWAQYHSSNAITTAGGTDLSGFLESIRSDGGYTCSLATTALISDNSDDAARQYVGVAVIGRYGDEWRTVASQVVKNPYYGMHIQQDETEDTEHPILPVESEENP